MTPEAAMVAALDGAAETTAFVRENLLGGGGDPDPFVRGQARMFFQARRSCPDITT